MIRLFYILPLFFLASSCFIGEELPPDQDVWPYSLPSRTQMSDSGLLRLDSLIGIQTFENITSLIIVREDQLIFENYYDNSFRNRVYPMGQLTRTFTTTLLDLLVRDGFIRSVNDSISRYLPEFAPVFMSDSLKSGITIRHLLENKSGLAWITGFPANQQDYYQMIQTEDWPEYVITRLMEAPPGLRYTDNIGGYTLLTRIMQNALGAQDLLEYLEENFFSPLGIEEYSWSRDSTHTLNGGNGLSLKTLDLVKFGHLINKLGQWKRTRIISREWIIECIKVHTEADPTYGYSSGLGWKQIDDNLPLDLNLQTNDVVFDFAENGVHLYTIPHLKMVVGITANNFNLNPYRYTYSFFLFYYILQNQNLAPEDQ